ncbi:MAG: LysR family transcriptional regulator [Pseudomonadota bacterium]
MDWEDIHVFEAVIKEGTVRRAAAALGVHHSTVSRRIESLEQTMGTRLFDRRPEGYRVTRSGEELAAAATRFSDDLNDVARHIAGRDTMLTGKVTLTMGEPLASQIIAPRLGEFCAEYPGLEITIKETYDLLDVARREADVAIRVDNNPHETLVGKRLFPYFLSVYATPDYVEKHDLHNHPENGRWIGWGEQETPFPPWTADTDFPRVPVWGGFPNLSTQLALTKAGVGIAMLPCFIGDGENSLVRITDRPPQPSRDIWILTHNDLRRTARIRAVMDFAEAVLRENNAAFLGKNVAEL